MKDEKELLKDYIILETHGSVMIAVRRVTKKTSNMPKIYTEGKL